MGSFFAGAPPTAARGKGLPLSVLHAMGCKVCPLAKLDNAHPDMPATGSSSPLVYMIGEAPSRDEDEEGRQFVGASGQMLRALIPAGMKDQVRFNNIVRTRPADDTTPSDTAIECCRPSIVADIERTKPKAIFGFGKVPLEWATGWVGAAITVWRGRRMPVRVGNHTCWYYPMLHPTYLLRNRRGGGDISEEERMFRLDVKRAFAEVAKLPTPKVHTAADLWRDIECITQGGPVGLRAVEQALIWASRQPDIGVDYETDRLRPYDPDAMLLTVAVANGERGYAFPIDHPGAEWTDRERQQVRELWKRFLSRAGCRRWVHNLAFEHEWTAVYCGIEFLRPDRGSWQDTANQAAILDERRGKQKPGPFALEFLVQVHFGFNIKSLSGLDRKKLKDAPVELVLRYNGGDARYHCLLGLHQERLIKEEGLEEPYQLALRRVPCVVTSQWKGVPVDQDEVRQFKVKYEKRLAGIEDEIAGLKIAGEFKKEKGYAFNPFSGPDVLYAFHDMLERDECVVVDKFSKKEKLSADEDVLTKIKHPLAQLIIDLRKANRQLSTYVLPLLSTGKASVLFPDGQMHAIFNTFFAETGRLSSEWPNLQNFPKRDGEAKEVRRQVKAPPGCVILAVDYGQIEARVIAMFTKDKRFVKALWENYDVHMEWAERIARAYPQRIGGKENLEGFKLARDPAFKKDPRVKVVKDFRTDIKNQWTFPLFFGAKLESAAGYLNIPPQVLRPQYEMFWEQFSGVADWQERQLEFYRENGYVEGLTHRRRRGPMSVNQIYNSPIQGTAAEIVLDAMCRLYETGDLSLHPEINIHDDFTYVRVPAKGVDDHAEKVIGMMLDVPFEWAKVVPISVEMSIGPNWADLEEVGTFTSDKWFA